MTCLTWIRGHLNTSLQGIHQLTTISLPTLLLFFQETKIPIDETIRYIDIQSPSHNHIKKTIDALICLGGMFNNMRLIFSNQPLTLIVIVHMYMRTHDKNIYLKPLIEQSITQMLNTYSIHFPLLTMDISLKTFLVGYQTQPTATTTTSRENIDSKDYMLNLISYQSPTQHILQDKVAPTIQTQA